MDNGFGPAVVFSIGDVHITETVTVTWFIIAVVAIFSFLVTRNFDRIPGKMQSFIEILVEGINSLTASTMGADKLQFAPYVATLLIYLAMANLIGLVGMRPPTADINTTMSLAMITFTMIHFNGVKRKKLGYFKGFFEPIPFLFPINVIGELATPISLGFRLFGNIVGGLIIMDLVYSALAGLSGMIFGSGFIPVFQLGIPAALHIYFDIFAGVLQSFIFAMLTMVNVSMAMD